MDYKDIAKGERFENVDKHLYRAVQGINEISPAGKEEFEKAKSNLSIVSPKSNISLYDHLSAILRRILRFGIEDPVEKLEDISLSIKSEKETREESEIIEITTPDEILKKFIEEKKKFYKLTSEVSREAIRTAEEDDENEDEDIAEASGISYKGDEDVDEDEDESPPGLSTTLPDLHFSMHRFNLAGIGLSADEVYELGLSLNQLTETYKLEQVRFWGKLFAITCSYYVAECSYQSGFLPENYGWIPDVTDEVESSAEKTSVEDLEATDTNIENEDESNREETGDDEEESEVPEERVIPPLPEPKVPKQKTVPPEEDGTGVNDKLYFVSTRIGQPWKRLPSLKPYHISDARRTQRYFTGHLESEVGGCVPFNGKEAHYLRAQIARISASTYLSPEGYYQTSDETSGEDEDEDEDENEDEDDETKTNKLFKSESYEFKSVLEMYSDSFKAWVHCRPAILDQGRCTPIKPDNLEEIEDEDEEDEEAEKDEEENDDEEKSEGKDSDEEEIYEALKEAKVPLLRSIAEDKALGRLRPWTLKLSSKLASITSILILQSNLWPGAYTFYDGNVFDSIYIGFGHKYSIYHYAPAISLTWQKEYEVDSELVEPEDSEVESPKEDENEDADDEDGDKSEDDIESDDVIESDDEEVDDDAD